MTKRERLTLGSPGEEQALSTSTLMELMSVAEDVCCVVECLRIMLAILVFNRFSSRLPKWRRLESLRQLK